MLLWWNDEKQYYSSTTRKYLTFQIPVGISKQKQEEMLNRALEICAIMNRTLILPRFYDGRKETALAHIVDVNKFSAVYEYRESTYLLHPLVPSSIK